MGISQGFVRLSESLQNYVMADSAGVGKMSIGPTPAYPESRRTKRSAKSIKMGC